MADVLRAELFSYDPIPTPTTETQRDSTGLNVSTAANDFAEHKGWKFQIWTEDTLRNLGIKVLKG